MANISGTNLAAPIVPFTTDDFYPTHEAKYGKGGWREVASIAERDAIPDARLEQGMSVFVTGENKLYILTALDLEADPQVKTWTQFESGRVDDVQVGNTSVVVNKVAMLGTMASESKDDYLPLSGGTVTGTLTVQGDHRGNPNIVLQSATYPNSTKYQLFWQSSNTVLFESDISNTSGTFKYYFSTGNCSFSALNAGNRILGASDYKWTNVYATKLNNGSDIIVPNMEGTMAVQVSTIPTADATYEGQIYQFTGTTDSTYTNGYFYKCVSDGEATPTYSWVQTSVQPSPDPLPSQSGNSGKFLTTDGTNASWGNALINYGYSSSTSTNSGLWISSTYTNPGGTVGSRSIALGGGRAMAAHSIQIGGSYKTGNIYTVAENNTANTVKIANENGNFEIMSADGTVPEARLADTTSATSGQLLKLDSNLDAQWTDLTASDIPSITLSKISDVTATATELNYSSGVTSNIQTQLNAKAVDADVVHTTGNETINGTKTFNETLQLKSNLSFRSYGSNDSGRLQFRAQPSDNVIRGTVAITDGYTTAGSGYNGFVAQMVARAGTTSSDPFNTMRVSNKGIEYIKEANDGTIIGQYIVVDDSGLVPSDRLATSGSTGQVLTKTASGQTWATISTTLAGLTDTTISNPTSGQVLNYNGSTWENSDLPPVMIITDYTA